MKFDERTLDEALDNSIHPFRITKWHNIKCECGHSVSFHFFTGDCKGAITDGCTCREVRVKEEG